MPAKWFTCPAGTVEIEQCLKECPIRDELPAGRCLSLQTLRAIAEQRKWKGKPSVTQLLKGTREAYLEIVTDYAIVPDEEVYRVFGNRVHAYLDTFTIDEISEHTLEDDILTGTPDFYDPATCWLIDHKVWGSYKVNRALGLVQVEIETDETYKTDAEPKTIIKALKLARELIKDDDTLKLLDKAIDMSERQGKKKKRKEWQEGGIKDRLEVAIQQNYYRILLEMCGYKVNGMAIEALVRDGGLLMANMRGVESKAKLIPINRISDYWIKKYMQKKKDRLLDALANKKLPPLCNSRERWKGRKCEKYCNVREVCINNA